jgi:hypothetical protein
MTATTTPTAEDFDAVRIIATTRTTASMLSETMDLGAALLSHYQAAIEDWGTELAGIVAAECACEDCSRSLLTLTRDIATASEEKARLTVAFDLLAALTPGLPPADTATIARICDEARP